MKTLKYSSVFKKIEDGSRIGVVYDGLKGFAVMATSGATTLGLEFTGENNRLFIKELRNDLKWTVKDEIEEIDFRTALGDGFNVNAEEKGVRVEPTTLRNCIEYAVMPVDGRSSNELLSSVWLVDGTLYGTDGHRLHRALGALPEGYGPVRISPFLLRGFIAAIMFDKKTAWIGASYSGGVLRLFGGNDSGVTVWLAVNGEESTTYQTLVTYFNEAKENLDAMLDVGALVIEQSHGTLREAFDAAPRLGKDGSVISFRVYPDKLMLLGSEVEESSPTLLPVSGVVIAGGATFLDRGDYLSVIVSHKLITTSLDMAGKVGMLVRGPTDYLWFGDPFRTCIIMPVVP